MPPSRAPRSSPWRLRIWSPSPTIRSPWPKRSFGPSRCTEGQPPVRQPKDTRDQPVPLSAAAGTTGTDRSPRPRGASPCAYFRVVTRPPVPSLGSSGFAEGSSGSALQCPGSRPPGPPPSPPRGTTAEDPCARSVPLRGCSKTPVLRVGPPGGRIERHPSSDSLPTRGRSHPCLCQTGGPEGRNRRTPLPSRRTCGTNSTTHGFSIDGTGGRSLVTSLRNRSHRGTEPSSPSAMPESQRRQDGDTRGRSRFLPPSHRKPYCPRRVLAVPPSPGHGSTLLVPGSFSWSRLQPASAHS